jgi:hypothetical protein
MQPRGFSLVHLVGIVILGRCALAVIVGSRAEPGSARVYNASRCTIVPGRYFYPVHEPLRFLPSSADTSFALDPETGRLVQWRSSTRDVLLEGTCSPWVDETGGSQVAGVWARYSDSGLLLESGLARFSYPGGALIDSITLDIVPAGPPCWEPTARPRIIFAAHDGRLYRLALDGARVRDGSGYGRQRRPVVFTWKAGRPGPGLITMENPRCPLDPRLPGILLVSLRRHTPAATPHRSESFDELWWLRLDPMEAAIEEAGPLFETDDAASKRLDRRFPALATQPDGSLVLAYLAAPRGTVPYELRVAPVQLDPKTRTPHAAAKQERILAADCAGIAPAFSADGQWITAVPRAEQPPAWAIRRAVPPFGLVQIKPRGDRGGDSG